MIDSSKNIKDIPVDSGSFTAVEAARLLDIPTSSIRRWLNGYQYKENSKTHFVQPLWKSDLNMIDDQLEISFRDLIELKFVGSFVKAGVGLLTIRNCLEFARTCVEDYHPFSTQRFQTDGRTIYLESLQEANESKLLNLRSRQYTFKKVIEQTFKELDLEEGAVARWRPFKGKKSIVIDPSRSFGQPIASDFGIPTVVLADAFKAEGSIAKVASLYEVPKNIVKDALDFEKMIAA